ncbi:tyrosine-protein phosphatase non-receptor type 22 [Menidia menidia]
MEEQAWILRGILTQLESQETSAGAASDCIAGEFEKLKNLSMKYRANNTFPTKAAEKQENIKKNRYKDIIPFDHTRVKLTLTTSKTDTDYINASFIKGVSGSRAYVATQGPLPHTVVDFLRMLWEYEIEVVVMACREFEMGKKKCELYWPQKQDETFVCKPFTVHCDSEENNGDYLTRTLRLTYCNCARTLKQLHYVNWPDHGVPDSIPPILDMLYEMRTYQDHDEIPICIHCSAGCGRTGALCVIDYTWNLLRKQMITPDFNIYNLVQEMRTQRPSVVQTKEQYLLVYRTIKLLFERYLHSMDIDAYQNESVAGAVSEGELSDLSEDSELMPQLQCLLEEERFYLKQNHTPVPVLGTALTPYPDLNDTVSDMPLELMDNSHGIPSVGDVIQGSDNGPSVLPEPPAAVSEVICHMVEDPYFDIPMNSPSLEESPADPVDSTEWTVSPLFNAPSLLLNNEALDPSHSDAGAEHTDEEGPPPIPERTPESYILAVDEDPCERLSVIIPPNAAAEAIREFGGSPPSPVPPLPLRTPESFELAIDPGPAEQHLGLPAVKQGFVGMSSEWSGTSTPAALAVRNEVTSHVRSKSLRAKMTFSAPVKDFDLRPNATSKPGGIYPDLDSLGPPLLHETEESLNPPLPERTRESFILCTDNSPEESVGTSYPSMHLLSKPLIPGKVAGGLERMPAASHPSGTQDISSSLGKLPQSASPSQPRKLLDVFTRSKSVRARSSREEPLASFQQLPPLPVVVAEGGSARVERNDANHRPPLSTEKPGNKSDKSGEKGMSRSKSLKLFKSKPKPTTAPPAPPAQPGAPPRTLSGSFAVFKFGFGNRFGKPKGPRAYPETWV